MGNRVWWMIGGVVLIGNLVSAGVWAGGKVLSLETPVLGQLSSQSSSIALANQAQDYLEVEVTVEGGPVDVELLDAGGKSIRLFLDDVSGQGHFRWLANDAEQTLRLTSVGTSDFRLTLKKQVPLAHQVAPAEPYLSPAIASVADVLKSGGKTDAFWAEVAKQSTPLIEPVDEQASVMTFLYRGAQHNVRVIGAPMPDHAELERLGDSDIWFKSFQVPNTVHLSYKLAPDVPELPGSWWERRIAITATAQADPLNKHPWPADAADRFNQASTVSLPDAPSPDWLQASANVSKGSLSVHRFESDILGNQRQISLYRPHNFDPKNLDNLLLFVFDAKEYQSKVPTPVILDNLIAAGQLPPVVAVFVDNASRAARGTELPDNAEFAKAMAEEILPWVSAETQIEVPAARTLLAGSSYGGLASTTIALRYPMLFGNVVSLSGSFWWHPKGQASDKPEYVADWVAREPTVPVRFFLSAGLYEAGDGKVPSILSTSRHLRDVLQAKDYDVFYQEYAAGHDYFAWRGILGEGLLALFGRSPSEQ